MSKREVFNVLIKQLKLQQVTCNKKNMTAKTLFDKIWDAHVVKQVEGGPNVLYIDRHFIHEVTSPVAFLGLKNRGLKVFRPDKTTATPDHNVPTIDNPEEGNE